MSRLRESVLAIALRHYAGAVIVDINGRLTAEASPEHQVVRTVRQLLQQAHPWIVLNLEGVLQIDSTGLSELVEAYTTTTRHHGQLKLLHVTRHVETLLRVTRLAQIFEIFASEPEAIESFRKSNVPR
jgi:anti-sigma B factor antagonist